MVAEEQLDLDKVRAIVDKVPGARIFQEGDKLEGQEEREEEESEWARGDFDPVGDLVVSGFRVQRGEGREFEEATGPQCKEHDDLVISVRGSLVKTGEEGFWTVKTEEKSLSARAEEQWEVALSDERLGQYWAKSFRAMSRGDWCRFTCAAKRAQAWLQVLSDCCTPVDPSNNRPLGPKAVIPTIGKKVVVEVRLDKWTPVYDVSRKKDRTLFKRVLEVPAAKPKRGADEELKERLRRAGEMKPSGADPDDEEVSNGTVKIRPRAPDRVQLRFELRRRTAEGWESMHSAGFRNGKRSATAHEYSLGKPAGGEPQWAVLDLCAMRLEEGERAVFSFGASESMLPMRELFGFSAIVEGTPMELDVKLERMFKCADVSEKRDNSVTKFKVEVGKSFWRPRRSYKVTITAGVVEAGQLASSASPSGAAQYTFHLFEGGELQEGGSALHCLVSTMALGEVSLVTARRGAFAPWPAGGPLRGSLPAGAADGTLTLWVRLDSFTRVEVYDAVVRKTTLNADDVEWLEAAFAKFKGELPVLEEDVLLKFACSAADAAGKLLFPETLGQFRTGEMPLCEDWMLEIFHTAHPTEQYSLACEGEHAAKLVRGLASLFAKQRSRTIDGDALAKHAAAAGAVVTFQMLGVEEQPARDGKDSAALIASIGELKLRANALFEAGYTAGAMRKYVRAAWLAQDGDAKEDPAAPMVDVVGIGSGKCRFAAGDCETVKALRVSLHLNLAAGAIKLKENYGALAAAKVAHALQPEGVKPLYRRAQAHLALQEFVEAEEMLGRLLRIEPNNRAARGLLQETKRARGEQARRTRATFSGMFDRAQREGPLFDDEEIKLQEAEERRKTKYVADRAEEKRRGVEALDVKEMSRLPEDYKQRELDKLNEAIENEANQSKVPEGLTEASYRKLIQMRTDGVREEKIQEEMGKMKQAEMEEARKYMLPKERERMRERNEACVRDRYKPDAVVREREDELWEEYRQIKLRVDRRKPLLEAESQRQEQRVREAQEVLNNPEATEEERAYVIRRMVHEPFQDLDSYLSVEEMAQLEEVKGKPEEETDAQQKVQRLLLEATQRRIEAKIDEMLDRENDVLI